MAIIRPFGALRFAKKAGELSDLCCPPYDVVSKEEQKALYEKSPYNVIRLEYNGADDPYAEAARLLDLWIREQILKTDTDECIYVYEDEFVLPSGEVKKTRGFVARIFLTPFSEGVVLPHEETLSKAKEDRFRLMEATGCNFSQIYSLYHDEGGGVTAVLNQTARHTPDACFATPDGVAHRLWILRDKADIRAVTEHMANKKIYIADGHHRYETAVSYKEHLMKKGVIRGDETEAPCYQMMAFVDMDDPGLVVLPTHRLLRNLPGFDKNASLDALTKYFALQEIQGADTIEQTLRAAADKGETSFAFYAGGDAYTLLTLSDKSAPAAYMPGKSGAFRALDVAVLHAVILEPIFGIDKEKLKNQANLTYTRSVSEAVEQVREGAFQCAFFVNATKVSQIRDVALIGEKMPQKSTYFYPKLITGAVMNKFM